MTIEIASLLTRICISLNTRFIKGLVLCLLAYGATSNSYSALTSEFTLPAKLYILSPHMDDAILTFGGHLNVYFKTMNKDSQITIIVPFSTTNYTAAGDNKNCTSKRVLQVSQTRFSEDTNALTWLSNNNWRQYKYSILGYYDSL